MDLKQNAFLRQWIYYIKPLSFGKVNKFSLLSLTCGFLPTNTANIVQTSERLSSLLEYFTASAAYFRASKYTFFTINAQIMRILFLLNNNINKRLILTSKKI